MTVRDVLERHDIVPRRRFGQNFLHDPRIARRIADAAEVAAGERVLEIGPGLGALTRPLLDSGVAVTAIEIDERVADFLRRNSRAGAPSRWSGATSGRRIWIGSRPTRALVANLPYSITGPVLAPPRRSRGSLRPRALDAAEGSRHASDPRPPAGASSARCPCCSGCSGASSGSSTSAAARSFRRRTSCVRRRFTRIPGTRLPADLKEAVNRRLPPAAQDARKTLAGFVADEAALAAALASLGHPEAARPEELAPEEWPALLAAARGRTS
jgi:16S rRNA A1518/A1519 N6-dimethyltransferase RsmA/KsgA/DIM1 with predicted DNA glycosylase/AP lyase activity